MRSAEELLPQLWLRERGPSSPLLANQFFGGLMSQFQPVTTLEDLDSLDSDEIVEGYWSGREGWPEPGDNRSRSYWHGWRNGASDFKHREIDGAQRELARVCVARSRASGPRHA